MLWYCHDFLVDDSGAALVDGRLSHVWMRGEVDQLVVGGAFVKCFWRLDHGNGQSGIVIFVLIHVAMLSML